MKNERPAAQGLPAWLNGQTVAIIGTMFTIGIGLGGMNLTSRAHMDTRIGDLSARIDGLSARGRRPRPSPARGGGRRRRDPGSPGPAKHVSSGGSEDGDRATRRSARRIAAVASLTPGGCRRDSGREPQGGRVPRWVQPVRRRDSRPRARSVSMNSRRGSTCSPMSVANIWSAAITSSTLTRSIRRTSGSIVVSQSCSGSISPKPL